MIAFHYTTPLSGSDGILRIQVKYGGGDDYQLQEITGSPIVFSLKEKSPSSTPPVEVEPVEEEGFFRLNNAVMWGGVGGVVGVVGLVWWWVVGRLECLGGRRRR